MPKYVTCKILSFILLRYSVTPSIKHDERIFPGTYTAICFCVHCTEKLNNSSMTSHAPSHVSALKT